MTSGDVVRVVVAGGNDKNAVVFNKDTEQVIASLQGHTKKVTGVIYHPEEVGWIAWIICGVDS